MRLALRHLCVLSVLTSTLAIAGCGNADPAADTAGGSHDGFPLTLQNCGRSVTIDSPPQRAVALNQGSAEILLSLGLADRLVGTATWTDPVRADLADANTKVPRLADNKPSLEVVLGAEPDFVSASFGGTLGPGGVADRDRFDQLGVPTYLSPTDCDGKSAVSVNSDGARTEPLRIDSVYTEIRQLATIFDVEDRGETLIASLRQRLESATATAGSHAGTTMAFWFSDLRTPYMAGCCGSSGIIANAVGAKNIFADTTDEWPQVSWETVADRDPSVLVLADLSRRTIDGDALDSKIAFLHANPVTSRMTAVREKRFVVVSGADLNPSLRTVDGVEKLAAALAQWGPVR
ncbi:ABC transporter substrate-binding protein [Nocardia barduliensis]|uniref:ABC transporter substrate-binding protein n=1 Tax=Nocardia barduliensis TaxID=2736643 RepID=UPI0015738092|nr:ABC transporter substrate-binding protein [Nocardia barduliensis]